MQIKRTVTLKIIVTEKFKEDSIKELEEAVQQVDQAKNQIDLRSRIYLAELQRVDISQAAEFRRRVEAEKHRQDEIKEHLNEELEQLRGIELGEEYTRGTLESFVDVAVGDDLDGKLGQSEVVVKDGVVVELRDPKPAE
ncbi:MAG TPA: YlqD family protein [Armatimonadota bacterium]|nr:YlqD family protein [Armatimonadota bacterium]